MSKTSPKIITVASSSNETYALGLAVSLSSVLRHLPSDTLAQVLVLDGGIKPSSLEKIRKTLHSTGKLAGLEVLKPEMSRYSALPKDWGCSVMAYARLALPDLTQAKRILYIDADMVVQSDASVIWDTDIGDNIVGACVDIITKTLGEEFLPLEAFGLPPQAPYMQSGLMIMNMDKWREFDVSTKVLEYIKAYPKGAKFWDQSALNVVIYGRWQPLPIEWNTPVWWAEMGRENTTLNAPLLHFVGPAKPWLLDYHKSKGAKFFFEALDHTAWKGWRPSRLRQSLKQLKYRLGKLLGR